MNIIIELSAMRKRMFNDKLLNSLLEDYKREMEEAGFTLTEEEYGEGKEALSSILDDRQAAQLKEAEDLCWENMKYAMEFAFFQGCRGFFQQLFSKDPPKLPFKSLVLNKIMTMPSMSLHNGYYETREKFMDIFSSISEELSPWHQEYIISVESAWEERLYGILRHAFYLGYRHALSSVRDTDTSSQPLDFSDMLATVEYELGFAPNSGELRLL